MTHFIAAYDTENPACLEACAKIRQVHERFHFPATFFIVGKRLEEDGSAYRRALGDCELFEIASHTYSHRMLRDHPFCGPAPELEERIKEICLGKQLVEDVFERPCLGLRPGCGFDDGLKSDPWLVDQVTAAGFRYISSLLWGPEYSLPAQMVRPFKYTSSNMTDLWELPGHGWHDNVLKAHNLTTKIQRLVAWPMPDPTLVPSGPVQTAEDEFSVNRRFIDRAIELDLPYISLIWHPWSLARFDPPMKMLELTFQYILDAGLTPVTFEQQYRECIESPN
jgi:hypothetical protein